MRCCKEFDVNEEAESKIDSSRRTKTKEVNIVSSINHQIINDPSPSKTQKSVTSGSGEQTVGKELDKTQELAQWKRLED
jgi:hypothetical protein